MAQDSSEASSPPAAAGPGTTTRRGIAASGTPSIGRAAGPGDPGARGGLALPPPLLPGRPRRGWRTCRRRPAGAGRRGAEADPGRPVRGRARAAPVLRRARPQGRFRHRHGRAGPEGHPRRPDGDPGLEPRARPWCRPIRSTRSPRSRSTSPTPSEYGRILREREGLDPESSIYKTKVAAYAERLGPMNRQRLYPGVPRLAVPLLLPDEQDARRPTRTGTCCRSRRGRS